MLETAVFANVCSLDYQFFKQISSEVHKFLLKFMLLVTFQWRYNQNYRCILFELVFIVAARIGFCTQILIASRQNCCVGSILGPLLYLVYTAPIADIIKNMTCYTICTLMTRNYIFPAILIVVLMQSCVLNAVLNVDGCLKNPGVANR